MAPQENVLGLRDISSHSSGSLKTASAAKEKSKKRAVEELSPEELKERQARKAARLEKLAEKRRKIICGVDFGTTYSGVAYVSSTDASGDVEIITKWNGGEEGTLQKAPSRVAYSSENRFSDGKDKWGYEVKPGMVACSWFKLLLDSSTKKSDFDDDQLYRSEEEGLLRLPPGKSAKEVTSDFLRHLYHHTLNILRDIFGSSTIDQTPILFELTIPATWSRKAREDTRAAAMTAGFGNRNGDDMAMVDEPESAAIANIKTGLGMTQGKGVFKPGMCALICDMGGGTVDLICYKIMKLDPLQLEEACVGEGGKCGGSTIDRHFHEFMSARFGKAFTSLPSKKTGIGSLFMDDFERAKRLFKGTTVNETFDLPLKMRQLREDDPEVVGYDFEEEMVRITSDDMSRFFEPVMEKTFRLIQLQFQRTKEAGMPRIGAICLCGGLGSSHYVMKRFRNFSQDMWNGGVEICTTKRGWSAIARGAALRGLEKSPILFRRSRDFIGTTVHERFVEGTHREEDVFHCPVFKEKRAKNQMKWQVSRGDKMTQNKRAVIKCYHVVSRKHKKEDLIIHQIVYSCTADEGPKRLDDTVRTEGRITMDLTEIVNDEKTRAKKAGERIPEVMKFDIEIELTMGSDKGIMVVTAKTGRKKIASTTIEYAADPRWKKKV